MAVACSPGPRILEVQPATDTSDPVGPYRLSASVTQEALIRDLSVLWASSRDGGSGEARSRIRLRRVGDGGASGVFEGAIPGQPYGSEVRYAFRLVDVFGSQIRVPEAPDAELVFHVYAPDAGRSDDGGLP